MFYQQDESGQLTVLRRVATHALAHWSRDPEAIELVSYTNNAVFAAGTDAILRVFRPDRTTLAAVKSERAWLQALHTHTDLCVPVPLADVYQEHVPELDGLVFAALSQRVHGMPLFPGEGLQPHHARAAGAYAAQLHRFAAGWDPPDPVKYQRHRLDADRLFGEGSIYDPGEAGRALLTPSNREVIDAVTARVREVMHKLGPTHLIHGDFIPKNTLFDGDQVCLVDFEYMGFGYGLYDLASMLLFYRDKPDERALADALLEGYATDAAQRDFLEPLIGGRYVASIFWVAGNAHNPALQGRARQIIDERAGHLRGFLETGRLSLPR